MLGLTTVATYSADSAVNLNHDMNNFRNKVLHPCWQQWWGCNWVTCSLFDKQSSPPPLPLVPLPFIPHNSCSSEALKIVVEREAGVPWWLVWPCFFVHFLFTATFIIFLQCITFSTLSLSPSSLSLYSLSSLLHCLHHSHHHCLFHQILVLCMCKLIIRVVGSVQWPVGCWWVPQNSCSLVSLYPNKNFPSRWRYNVMNYWHYKFRRGGRILLNHHSRCCKPNVWSFPWWRFFSCCWITGADVSPLKTSL